MTVRAGLWAALVLLCGGVLAGCGHAPLPNDPHFPAVAYLQRHDATVLGDALLVPISAPQRPQSADRPSLPFHSEHLWRYVTEYARGGNDCPEGQYDGDCAHFQSHALAAAGVTVAHPTAVCKSGLCIRVRDLAVAFDNASRTYANVTKFTDPHLARRGDFCFLSRLTEDGHDHLMLLAAPPDADGAFVYSHTNNRVGTHAPFNTALCVFYRIEDR